MDIPDRLASWVGHDIIVTNFPEHEGDVPPGQLREVGSDYLVIQTKAEAEGGFAGDEGATWLVATNRLSCIIHMSDCAACAVEAAAKNKGIQR